MTNVVFLGGFRSGPICFQPKPLSIANLAFFFPCLGHHLSRILVGRMLPMCVFWNALRGDGFRSSSINRNQLNGLSNIKFTSFFCPPPLPLPSSEFKTSSLFLLPFHFHFLLPFLSCPCPFIHFPWNGLTNMPHALHNSYNNLLVMFLCILLDLGMSNVHFPVPHCVCVFHFHLHVSAL
jgi:hypothetical protein